MEITGLKKSRIVFGIIITSGLVLHIIFYFKSHPEFFDQILKSLESTGERGVFILSLILFSFSLVNWGLESFKWKILSKPVEEISGVEAVSDVLSGLIIGNFLPRSAGDLIARIGRKNKKSKWELFGALLVNNLAQLCVTLVFGVFGVVMLSNEYLELPKSYLLTVSGVILLMCLSLYFFRKQLIDLIGGRFPKIFRSVKAIKSYSKKTLLTVSILSCLRYVVFTSQLMIVLYFQGNDEITFIEFLVPISLIFLTKTLIPSFNFLSDLGIRQYSHVIFLSYISVSAADATSAGLIIWLMNICIPSFIGLFFLWKK